MPSWRKFAQLAFQCAWYEGEDVIIDSDDVDLLCLDPGRHFRVKEKWLRRLLFKDISRQLAYINPGLRPVRLKKQYDLFFVHCQVWWDLLYVNAIENWKEHCKTSVCWIDELWLSTLPRYKYWLPSLARFDHVIIGMAGTVPELSKVLGRPCHYVPGGVDAIRFSPYPKRAPRVIDVYSMGRRREGIHSALSALAQSNGMFYLYDTLQSGESKVPDYRQHRELLANLIKRTRHFVVAPAKINVPEDTQGQIEIAFRYYEASAAGAVMVGESPNCEAFRQMFNWPDAVIEFESDGSDVVDVLQSLARDPERLSEISRRNAAEALQRHDWMYRWKQILSIAGLKPAPPLEARARRLQSLAEMARSES